MQWYRVWIDLDAAGRCRGVGYELRDEQGERHEINVLPAQPDHDYIRQLERALVDIGRRFGWRQDLFEG